MKNLRTIIQSLLTIMLAVVWLVVVLKTATNVGIICACMIGVMLGMYFGFMLLFVWEEKQQLNK